MDCYLEELVKRNEKNWYMEVEKEIKRRNKWLHALKTMLICNEYVTGKRKEKWLREEWW